MCKAGSSKLGSLHASAYPSVKIYDGCESSFKSVDVTDQRITAQKPALDAPLIFIDDADLSNDDLVSGTPPPVLAPPSPPPPSKATAHQYRKSLVLGVIGVAAFLMMLV